MEKSKVETHRWKIIAWDKGEENLTSMEDEVNNVRDEMGFLKIEEASGREHLEKENQYLRNRLKQAQGLLRAKYAHISTT